jgi:SAM-dependent methyltransferase
MTEQRFVFGEVADLYDRFRPGYPEELVERVLHYASLPAHGRILEVGCGTGQATRAFAERGHEITCLEPSPPMASLAVANLERYSRLEVVVETFEAWPLPERPFELVISATAFHWVDPELRFVKAARVLRPGGVLALFGHVPQPEGGLVREQIDRAYAECVPSIAAREPGSAPKGIPLAEDFAQAVGFGELVSCDIPWSRRWSATDYIAMLRTQSNHAMLPERELAALLSRIEAIIERSGGFISVQYVARLLMARRQPI